MAAFVLCIRDDYKAERLGSFLAEDGLQFCVQKSKSGLFDYLNMHKAPTVLILEAGFMDSDEFFMLLQRSYSWVKVFMLSSLTNLQDASRFLRYDIRGYGNIFCNSYFFKRACGAIQEDGYWYYPEFLQTYKSIGARKYGKIGTIENIENSVYIKSNGRQKEAKEGDSLYLNDMIIVSKNGSNISFNVGKDRFYVDREETIYLDTSVCFSERELQYCLFSHDGVSEILSFFDKKDSIMLENRSKSEEKEKIVAKYSGTLDEYEIYPSKNLNTFFVIKDKISNRDGSDLVGAGIETFVFTDIEIKYSDLCKISI